MADSIREKVLKEIFSRISTVPAFAGTPPRVFRSRTALVARNEMPAAIIMPLNEDPVEVTNCRVKKTLTIAIFVCVHSDIPDQAADPIITDICKCLMPTVDGRANFNFDNMPGVQDVAEAGIQFKIEGYDGTIPFGIAVKYSHSQGDPTVL